MEVVVVVEVLSVVAVLSEEKTAWAGAAVGAVSHPAASRITVASRNVQIRSIVVSLWEWKRTGTPQ